MLVLSRKAEESIRIGDDVVLTVLSIQGNRVRFGIEAPVKVVIRRSELPPLTEWTKPVSPVVPHQEPFDPTEPVVA